MCVCECVCVHVCVCLCVSDAGMLWLQGNERHTLLAPASYISDSPSTKHSLRPFPPFPLLLLVFFQWPRWISIENKTMLPPQNTNSAMFRILSLLSATTQQLKKNITKQRNQLSPDPLKRFLTMTLGLCLLDCARLTNDSRWWVPSAENYSLKWWQPPSGVLSSTWMSAETDLKVLRQCARLGRVSGQETYDIQETTTSLGMIYKTRHTSRSLSFSPQLLWKANQSPFTSSSDVNRDSSMIPNRKLQILITNPPHPPSNPPTSSHLVSVWNNPMTWLLTVACWSIDCQALFRRET